MLELRNLSKKFGDFQLENINLSVQKGEYFVILGLSGAGKTVLLEVIAGLEDPDQGKIILNNKDITRTSIQKRNVGIVFQDYALFPHLTVRENIIYPLKNKKISKKIIEQKITELGKIVSVSHILDRKPDTLSGGELQRVALARTLALDPDCLLLDEPLSSLDVQLRDDLRGLLRTINRKGYTILHVTHDYQEAIALAHKVAIIHEGRITQTGTPKEVFHNPGNKFVANFTGIKNFFNAKFIRHNTILAENKIEFAMAVNHPDGSGYIMFGKENVIVSLNSFKSSVTNQFKGKVIDIIPLSTGIEILVDVGIKVFAFITERSLKKYNLTIGNEVWVSVKAVAIKFISSR